MHFSETITLNMLWPVTVTCVKRPPTQLVKIQPFNVRNQSVRSGKVAIVNVVVVNQVNCKYSANVDSCAISFSLTKIPNWYLSEQINPFSFMKPI